MKKSMKSGAIVILVFIITCAISAATIFAAEGDDTTKAKRTIMLYDCGTDLETGGKMASYNLRQILRANFSEDEDIRFIIMTGGTNQWHLEEEYLEFPDEVYVPDDAVAIQNPENVLDEQEPAYARNWIVSEGAEKTQISNVYNQIWEAKGADSKEYGVEESGDIAAHGKMVLLDGDGILGDGDPEKGGTAMHSMVLSDDYGGNEYLAAEKRGNYEWMNNSEVLKAFINYCVDYAPADKYDLIFWDHGYGIKGGFCNNEQDPEGGGETMDIGQIMEALSQNKVTDADEDGEQDGKFDLVNFDACLMSGVEVGVALADYTDYFIASPRTVPGYGQYYQNWLTNLGKGTYDEEGGTYAMGQKIVDDFIAFYSKKKGDGAGQSGTMAVIDMNKLMTETKSPVHAIDDTNNTEPMDFVTALTALTENLAEDLHDISYYDEFRSMKGSIEYNEMDYYDLGNLVSLLACALEDADLDNVTSDGEFDDTNRYTGIAEVILGFLSDEDIIYAGGTKQIHTDNQFYRKADGEMTYGTQGTSGIYLCFSPLERPNAIFQACHGDYPRVISRIKDTHPDRATFLEKHLKTMENYGIAMLAGQTVTKIITDGTAKSKVTYDTVKKDWEENGETEDFGNLIVDSYIEALGGEEAVKEWLEPMIEHMRDDVILTNQIDVQKEEADGKCTGYRITFNDVWKQAIDDVQMNLVAELPAAEKFLNDPENEEYLSYFYGTSSNLTIGSVSGDEVETITDDEILSDDETLSDGTYTYESVIKWLHTKGSTWDLEAHEDKWYALIDAEGNVSPAGVQPFKDQLLVPTGFWTWEMKDVTDPFTGDTERKKVKVCHLAYLIFDKDTDEDLELTEIAILQESGGYRFLPISEYEGELKTQPLLDISDDITEAFLPTSDTHMTINKKTLKKIRLEYMDISDIPGIADIDGDKESVYHTVTVTNVHGYELDITDKFKEANPLQVKGKTASVEYKNLKKKAQSLGASKVIETVKKGQGTLTYKLTSAVKGKKSFKKYFEVDTKTGKVTVKKKLVGGTYTVKIQVKAAGNHTYKASSWKTAVCKIKVNKEANPLKVKGKTASVKRKTLKKKAKTLGVSKVIKTVKAGQGKRTYKLLSAKKGKKSFKKYFKVNSKTGKVTVKKKLKKGTYKVKIKVKAAGNNNYKASAWKTVVCKIKVK